MGREERFPSTGYIPAWACWLCYGCVLLGFVTFFRTLPKTIHPFYVGLVASIGTTVLVFAFALRFRNTSIYDPYWCWYPLFAALCWTSSASADISARSCYTLLLLLTWCVRYNVQWTWEGWTKGVHTEDWRYPMMAAKLGIADSTGFVYWFVISLLGSHIVPTLLVWFVLAPVECVWSVGATDAPPLGLLDAAAVGTSLSGVALQFVADGTLRRFRSKHVEAKAGATLETQVCGRTCREGPWGYSRHPNYAGEVLFWLGMDLAALAGGSASRDGVAWALGGILNYACFFRVSASLMDKRSLKNRPGYETIMKEVNALFPCPLVVDRLVDRLLVQL
eukprot:TRINITY_DN1021_c0_g1_i1.p1 TRINITY_DN1021_c0_g1~~TRINITY_DN1021_c0_g1_i1.p1  ORF type:complete len:335 (+),score=52.10 TRINITY_DN1021_c0_g1_i1:36-1040(+)